MKKPIFLVSKETFKTIENIADGVLNPLRGFLNKVDFESVLKRGRLKNGSPWTIPIVFDVEAGQLKPGQEVILKYKGGSALFSVKEIFPYSKLQYARSVFGTLDENHPGVQKIKRMKNFLAGGKITLIKKSPQTLKNFIVSPAQTKEIFKNRGWQTVVAFQTRNVPHVGHEYLQKTALNLCDGLFINPVIGRKKSGDFKDNLIKKTYEILINNYFPKEKVLVAGFNYEMQYAGPKEAIHHAIIRKNFGCTHFIVGRDHAGVGNYYHPFAAQEIFKKYPDLGITPIFLPSFFYCKKCKGIVSEKTCPHPKERIEFKGTNLRKILFSKKDPPTNLMRPEVVKIIKRFKNPFV
jgi:sulfate adenylyltransferase